MVAPIAPIAWTALRIGAVAATAYYVRRRTRLEPKHAWRERALDDTPEGIDLSHNRGDAETCAHASARFRRVLRFRDGPALEVDLSALGRLRFRRVE